MVNKIGVIGAGAWGIALATVASRVNDNVIVLTRHENAVTKINQSHKIKKYLSYDLPSNIKASSDFSDIIDSDVLFIVVPVHAVREICLQLRDYNLSPDVNLVLCAKGIEEGTILLVSEIVAEILPQHKKISVLSGPNFAKEVTLRQPTATTIASVDKNNADKVMAIIGNAEFRTYFTNDIIGTQICGAAKNVLAIACGIARGKGFGENTVAALITRGIAEIGRLVVAKGGNFQTIMALCGVGDIVLTCSSLESRNNSLGHMIGKGMSMSTALEKQSGVVEGVYTAQGLYYMCEQLKIEMPICNAVYKILYGNEDIDETIHHLLARPLTNEVRF